MLLPLPPMLRGRGAGGVGAIGDERGLWLRESWRLRDKAFGDYAAMFCSDDRILIVANGELLLIAADGKREILSRQRVFPENLPIYSHPALVGKRMFIRGESALRCIGL